LGFHIGGYIISKNLSRTS